ncbi:hypothetical protein [Rhizobium aouanii]|uniref:Uncharacterized protein n=1 Tax=Rhizobium aouanii TaxID=3118145 RepID=A0ABU8CKG1_9HYPH
MPESIMSGENEVTWKFNDEVRFYDPARTAGARQKSSHERRPLYARPHTLIFYRLNALLSEASIDMNSNVVLENLRQQ